MKLLTMIEQTLEVYPETRNSDIALTTQIWVTFFPKYVRKGASGDLGVYLKDLYELPREDNVKRYRAKLNSEGKYLPTDPQVIQARGLKEEEWREDLGYEKQPDTL